MLPINSCDRWDAFALSGRLSVASIPRALPWAICFLAFQAAVLQCQVPQYRFPDVNAQYRFPDVKPQYRFPDVKPLYRFPDVSSPVSFSLM